MNWSVGAVFHMSGSFTKAYIRKQWRSGWWRRSGLGGTHALYSWQCLASAKGSEAHIPCSVAFPNAAQLGAFAYCINGTYWGEKRKYIILQSSRSQSPPPPSKSSPPHTNSSNRYRFYAYFSHSSISNAYVKGS